MSSSYNNPNRICPHCSADNRYNQSDYCDVCEENITGQNLNQGSSPNSQPNRSSDSSSVRVHDPNMVRGRVEQITYRTYGRRNSFGTQLLGLFVTGLVMMLLLAFLIGIAQAPQLVLLLLPLIVMWFGFSMVLGLGNKSYSTPDFWGIAWNMSKGLFNFSQHLFGLGRADMDTPVTSLQILDEESNLVSVEIIGNIRGGLPQIGNEVEIRGKHRRGTVEFRRGSNLTTRAEIRVERS
jgi:hypothetical protein